MEWARRPLFFMANERLAERFEHIEAAIVPLVEREGFELVDFELKRGPKRALLRITLDRAGVERYVGSLKEARARPAGERGVTISDCARMSKLIGPILDVEDLVPSPYNLEVSSPGVNRPLRTPSHFARAVGLTVRVKTRVPVDGDKLFIAELLEADDERLVLGVGERRVEVPYRHVSKANIEFQF